MPRITDTVKHLLIINVLMFFGTRMLMDAPPIYGDLIPDSVWGWGWSSLALFFPTSEFFKPFQIITHMFMHADLNHLFFNMFAVYMFGSAMEVKWGAKKFLFYYLFTGFGAMILHMIVQYLEVTMGGGTTADLEYSHVLGASGAVFGLLIAYGMSFPNNVLQLLFPPIALKAKYFVLIYAVVELYLGVSGTETGIAHFAHLGGALFGFLLIMYWRKNDTQWLS